MTAKRPPFKMKSAERTLRNLAKREAVLTFCASHVIADAAQIAHICGTGKSAAYKLVAQMIRDGQLIQHEYAEKRVYSLTPASVVDFNGYKFDERRSANQVNHLLGLGWIYIKMKWRFGRWWSDRNIREMIQKKPKDEQWKASPDALAVRFSVDTSRGKATAFELELWGKDKSESARFYHDCFVKKSVLVEGADLESVMFAFPNKRRADGFARRVGGIVVTEGEQKIYLRDSDFWPRFDFITQDEVMRDVEY